MFYASLADDKGLLDLIDQAEKEAPPVFHGNQHQGGAVDIVNRTTGPDGNTRQHALRKLRKDRPDLHAQVLAEKLSSRLPCAETGIVGWTEGGNERTANVCGRGGHPTTQESRPPFTLLCGRGSTIGLILAGKAGRRPLPLLISRKVKRNLPARLFCYCYRQHTPKSVMHSTKAKEASPGSASL